MDSTAISVVPVPGRIANRGAATLWVVPASLGLGLALLQGWGAFYHLYDLKPKVYTVLQFLLVATTYVMSPRRTVHRVFLPVPLVLYGSWWVASYAWTNFPQGFFKSNMEDLTTVMVVVVLSSMLTRRQLMRTIVVTGALAFSFVLLSLLTEPGFAYTPRTLESGASGLRGAFIHKTNLATCLLLFGCAVCCYEARRWVRNVTILAVGIMVFLSNSSAGLGTGIALMAVGTVLFHKDQVVAALGRGWKSISLLSAVSGVAAMLLLLGAITSLLGKDLTFSGRDEVWAGTIQQIQRRPLAGWSGTNHFLLVQLDPARSIDRPLGYVAAHTHNGVLEILLRLGIVGLVLYVWLFCAAIRNGVRLLGTDPQLGRFVLLAMVIAGLFAISEILTVSGVWIGLTAVFASRTLVRSGEPSITELRMRVVPP